MKNPTTQGVTLREAAQALSDHVWENVRLNATGRALNDALRTALSHPPAPEQPSGEHVCPDCGCHFSGEFPFHYATHTAEPVGETIAVPSGIKIERNFRWDGDALHHVSQLLIEFYPVPMNSPNDAKGWADRDALAAALSASPAAPEAEKQTSALTIDRPVTFGGCPFCGKQDCVAGQCQRAAKPAQQAQAGEPEDFKSVAMSIYHADDGGKSAWEVGNIRELAMMRKVWGFSRETIAKKDAALKACVEYAAKAIYSQWKDRAGYVLWVEGGNSMMQDEARAIAHAAITQAQGAMK